MVLVADDMLAAIDSAAVRENFDDLTSTHDVSASFPWSIWNALVQLGVPALEIPESDGGLDLQLSDVTRIMQHLGYHSIAASTAYFTFTGFGSHVIAGLEKHPLRELLGPIASGDVRTALSLTEPGGGSHLASMRTRLERDGEDWLLRGAKLYTTLAAESTHLVVGALVPGDQPWSERMALVVIERGSPGVSISRLPTQTLRVCPTYEVAYDDVRVSKEQVIGPELAFKQLMATLNLERIAVAAQSCGLASRAFDDALAYTRMREHGAGTLLDLQVVQHQLVSAWQSLISARALLDVAVQQLEAGQTSGVLSTMAQRQAATTAYEVANLNVQLHGGFGLTTEARAQRLWRDTRLHLIGPVAQEASADFLARKLMNIQGSITTGDVDAY